MNASPRHPMFNIPTRPALARHAAALLVTLGAGLAACADDTIVSPNYGARCIVGSIGAGQVIDGALTEASCMTEYNVYSGYRTPYATYTVRLDSGRAYLFRQVPRPDPALGGARLADPLLSLWARTPHGTTEPLTVSDDNGGDRASEFFFVAPRSGTYHLVAGSYYGPASDDVLGGYRLTMLECPVVATLHEVGSVVVPLEASPCIRRSDLPGTTYRFVSLRARANERLSVTLSAQGGGTLLWELFGPDFDTYANIRQATTSHRVTGAGTRTIDLTSAHGLVTLAIGVHGDSSTAARPETTPTVSVARLPLP